MILWNACRESYTHQDMGHPSLKENIPSGKRLVLCQLSYQVERLVLQR